MRRLALGILLIISFSANAVEGGYPVSGISPLLRINARAVIRLEEYSIDIQSLEKLVIRHHFVVTVFDEEGSKHAHMLAWYDMFSEIKSIEGNLYDAYGKKIKSLKNKDISDESYTSSISLAEDNRYKEHDFYHKVYPYTVEYFVEEIKKESMFFPAWKPVWDEFISVENSNFQIRTAKSYLLRFKPFNYKEEPVVKEDGDKKIYQWSLKSYPAISREYASPAWSEITPGVVFAPSSFKIEDYSGKMTDWNEFGKFQNALNKGRDVLPPPVKNKVYELTKNAKTAEEKIAVLYQLLQSSTRYISIQLGIGGWRPFDATSVASNSYGDCKALSNYMFSLLKEAGIRSHYALIRAGRNERDLLTDFASSQFNHAILCVPNGNDTIWLECTSQINPLGYMGSFTGNRHALIMTEEGGKVVRTPSYGLKENLQIRAINATLNQEGTLSFSSSTKYSGIQQDDLHQLINSLSQDKLKEYLHKNLDLVTYDINHFKYDEDKSRLPVITETLDINAKNYGTMSGKRLFIMPNVLSKTSTRLSIENERRNDLHLKYAYTDIDSVKIVLPIGYTPEAVPKDVSISTKFGNYISKVKIEGNNLHYYRMIEHFGGRFPAKDYKELAAFYEAIYKADRSKLVMVKAAD